MLVVVSDRASSGQVTDVTGRHGHVIEADARVLDEVARGRWKKADAGATLFELG